MKKRFLIPAILGGVLLLTSCYQYVFIPIDTGTTEREDYTWDGSTADIDWYTASPDAPSYMLSTPEEFAGLASLVQGGNSMKDKTIILTNDIDLGGYDWQTIGKADRDTMEGDTDTPADNTGSFQGTFDGSGHTISGLSITVETDIEDDGTGIGFFGATNGATIKNVTFDGANIVSGTNTTGVAVGYAQNTTIQDVIVSNSKVTSSEGAGAIAGRVYLTEAGNYEITANKSIGNIITTDTSYNAGGLIGCIYNKNSASRLKMTANTVDMTEGGSVTSQTSPAGGIVGTITLNLSTEGNEFSENQVKLNALSQINIIEKATDASCYMGLMFGNSSNLVYAEDDNNTVVYNGVTTQLSATRSGATMSGNNFITGSKNYASSQQTDVADAFTGE